MEKIKMNGREVSYGFCHERKIFKVSFSEKNLILPYELESKDLLIGFLVALMNTGSISKDLKEEILLKALRNPLFPEVVIGSKPIVPIKKISYMVDTDMPEFQNPTVNMWNEEEGKMPCACIFEESKYTGIKPSFPFFRFKEEGLYLLSYLKEKGKIKPDDFMVMRAQVNKLPLPLNYLTTSTGQYQ